jgi:hypothetical protein
MTLFHAASVSRVAGLAVTASLIGGAICLPAVADPLSDTFQPDVFRTNSGLSFAT